MIEPERILYYMENLSYLLEDDKEQAEIFMKKLYSYCHIGTASMHHCQHPDWEEDFLKDEKALIDSGNMTPYHERKEKGPIKEELFPRKS